MPPAEPSLSVDNSAPAPPVFSSIERQVLSLAEQAALQGRPCTLSSHYLRRARRILLGERLAPPLADARLEALRRLACAAFSSGSVGAREAAAAAAAGVSQAQIDGVAGMVRALGRHRPGERRLLSRRRRANAQRASAS